MDWNTRDVARVYSQLAREWDYKSKLIRSKWGTTNRLRKLIQEMDGEKRKKLLDFGSGTGKVYKDLVSVGGCCVERVIMVDASGDMCRVARERISGVIPADIINGDEYSVEISEFAPYDVITMMQVLHHLPMPERTLIELRRYASRDAVLIALTPGPLYQKDVFPYESDAAIDLVGRRATQRWEGIIESAGWQIETIYDDRFTMEFVNEEDYTLFIRSIGITNRMSGYTFAGKAVQVPLISYEKGPIRILGQYSTFFCRLGEEGVYVE